MRITLAALVLFSASTLVDALSPAPARFEVASVKVDPKQSRGGFRSMGGFTLRVVEMLPGGRVESYGHTLRDIIAWPYEVNTFHQRVEGTQQVLQTEFEIEAKAVDSSLTPAASSSNGSSR